MAHAILSWIMQPFVEEHVGFTLLDILQRDGLHYLIFDRNKSVIWLSQNYFVVVTCPASVVHNDRHQLIHVGAVQLSSNMEHTLKYS